MAKRVYGLLFFGNFLAKFSANATTISAAKINLPCSTTTVHGVDEFSVCFADAIKCCAARCVYR